ncbi:hypothetical protein E8D34_06655 [Nocardioides sp. GY 10113]|uniref:hypothetical protein n=1 Tax=Nocardioides sp. GY 10113 TaxID=2569761 RepID=UPI0010A7E9B8|nr:hypothetical protein [Nocardioides sp. GY 10113]TIC87968.1 hypothetical protein E8D34_06655 [Nocardioides sp. GY 10113]
MHQPILRRSGPTLAAGALAALAVTAVPPASPAHAAADPEVNAQVSAAATWLTDRLTGDPEEGQLLSPDGGASTDVGATIDAGIGILETGAALDFLDPIKNGVDGAVLDWAGGADLDPARVARAVSFYSTLGGSLDVDGTNLLDELEILVLDGDGTVGASDAQARVVGAFNAVDSAAPDSVDPGAYGPAVAALLDQRCGDHGWGAGTGGACSSDVDTTARAVRALTPLVDHPELGATVGPAVDDGVEWLLAEQISTGGDRGGFDGGAGVNAVSTGLAASALHEADESTAATAAAAWLRGHQVADLACETSAAAQVGAVARDDSDLAAGVGAGNRRDWLRTTAQTFPALAWVPNDRGTPVVTAPRFANGGGKVTLRTTGLATGERACVVVEKAKARALVVGGLAPTTRVALPDETRRDAARLDGTDAASTFISLGSTRLAVKRAASVEVGARQKVRVLGLRFGENVRVKYGKKVVGKGTANRRGVFVATFKVGRAVGTKKVTARGHFADRAGRTTFRVRR